MEQLDEEDAKAAGVTDGKQMPTPGRSETFAFDPTNAGIDIDALLGKDCRERYDDFDLAQFRHVAAVCRDSESAADAAKKLFSVSRALKKSTNDSDRLTKYLARFGLKFKDVQGLLPH